MQNNFKRDKIKYIRDKAKARYQKGTECFICGTKEKLDFHHFNTLTPLFNKWVKINKIIINTEKDILDIRDRFINEHEKELYFNTITLCHEHHLRLHSLYGKDPPLSTALKQAKWVSTQKEKYNGLPRLDQE